VAKSSKKDNDGLKRRASTPKDSVGSRSKTLEVVETVVLGTAVVSHTMSLRNNGGKAVSDAHYQFLSGCIVASLVLRKLVSGMHERRRESSPTSQAMLRLRNAESAIEDQVKVLDVVLRDMDALKTRSRLVGRDVKSAMKQMDQTHALTGDVLRDTNVRMDMLENKVGEMEGLIGSVHEVVSKQLNLIRNVIQEQKALRERMDSAPEVSQGDENVVTTNNSTHTSSSIEDVHSLKHSTDEWGRTQPMMSVSAPHHDSKDGTILFSFDSN